MELCPLSQPFAQEGCPLSNGQGRAFQEAPMGVGNRDESLAQDATAVSFCNSMGK